MKKSLLLTIFLLLTNFFVIAQSKECIPIAYEVVNRLEIPTGQNIIIVKDAMPNLDGSPYLNDEWQNGSIQMKNGDSVPSIMLRYNVYKGEMQFQNKDNIYAIGATEDIKKIIMGNRVFIYSSYTDEGKSKKGYFEVLIEGKSSLLSLYYPEILPSNFNVALNSGNKNDQIALKNKYFLKTGDNFVPIDKKGKNIFSSFEQKGKEIQKYAKDNKLSFKKEPDLITITKFVNSLN